MMNSLKTPVLFNLILIIQLIQANLVKNGGQLSNYGEIIQDLQINNNPRDGQQNTIINDLYVEINSDWLNNNGNGEFKRVYQETPNRLKRYTNNDHDLYNHFNNTISNIFMTTNLTIPNNMQNAITNNNFQNITIEGLQQTNPKVLEYLKPSLFLTMPTAVQEQLIDIYLLNNYSTALARVLYELKRGRGQPTLDLKYLLERKIKLTEERHQNGIRHPTNSEQILIYLTATNSLGNYTTDQRTIALFISAGVLKFIPEELFMRVLNSHAAITLLTTLYASPLETDNNNIDDKALIAHLIIQSFGQPTQLTLSQFDNLATKFYPTLPANYLSGLQPALIQSKLNTFRDIHFPSNLQRKVIIDKYLESRGITNNNKAGAKKHNNDDKYHVDINGIVNDLGSFSCFINPNLLVDDRVRLRVIEGCSELGVRLDWELVIGIWKGILRGNPIEKLNVNDFNQIGETILYNSPPNIIRQAIYVHAIKQEFLQSLSRKIENGEYYLNGLVQQLTKLATDFYRHDLNNIPPAFLGGCLTISHLLTMKGHEDQIILNKLNRSESSMNDVQKGVFLTKLITQGILEFDQQHSTIPPALASFLPHGPKHHRTKLSSILVQGLPSESDLRLSYGEQFPTISLSLLESNPLLIGTLQEIQIKSIELGDIPSLLAIIRKSNDGPSFYMVKVLADRLAEYIRNKTDLASEMGKNKLLKYLSAAEISLIPGTVLSWFIGGDSDGLNDEQKLEILVSLGSLSTKDHALVPKRTRDLMVRWGLEVLDKHLLHPNAYSVTELTYLANSVVDLPPPAISKLTNISLELALDVIQGQVDDDDDGLHQRACLTPEQRKSWRNKLIETYGATKSWTPMQVQVLCCSLPLLDEQDLLDITKESLVNCKCVADEKPATHLKNLKQALNGACAFELGRPDTLLETLENVRSMVGLELMDFDDELGKGSMGDGGRISSPASGSQYKKRRELEVRHASGGLEPTVSSHGYQNFDDTVGSQERIQFSRQDNYWGNDLAKVDQLDNRVKKVKHHHYHSNTNHGNNIHKRFKRDSSERDLPPDDIDQSTHDPTPLHCTTLRLLPSSTPSYSPTILQTFWEKQIFSCLYELGYQPLSIEQARILWKKLINMNNKQVSRISVDSLKKAGYILRGITKHDVELLDFGNDDVVACFGVGLGLRQSLVEHMATHLIKSKHKTWSEFNAYDLIITGNIICGADLKQLQSLDLTAFRNALPHLKQLHQDCDLQRLQILASLTKNQQIYGDIANWTAADVRSIGILFKGLNPQDINLLQPPAFLGLSPSAATNLLPEQLRMLTTNQVEQIPRFTALAMRQEQLNYLQSDVRSVLDGVRIGSGSFSKGVSLVGGGSWFGQNVSVLIGLVYWGLNFG